MPVSILHTQRFDLLGKLLTGWRSALVLVLVLGLLQGTQQLFDLVGEVGLLDQVLGGLSAGGPLVAKHRWVLLL